MLQAGHLLQGRYKLQECLAQNAGRQTWIAVDQSVSSEEKVIVKFLAFSPEMQWEDFKLFEREAQVLKNLSHPRIPKYRDYFSVDKQVGSGLYWFALVQDYIPGKSLQNLLDAGRHFTEKEVRSLAVQVLKILCYLHELSPLVLHRDLKPSNFILGEDRKIYLVDFGAVQEQGAVEGVTFTVVGTAGYAPLEQFWGRAVPASDLYSLGATLIHILTGVAPVDLPQKNLKIQFRDRVSINPNLVYWIEALTAPDLSQRYQTAQEALTDLKANRYLNAPLQKNSLFPESKIQLWQSPTQLKVEIQGRGILIFFDAIALILKLILAASSFISLLAVFLLLGSSLAVIVSAIIVNYLNFSLAFVLVTMLFFTFMMMEKFSSALSKELFKLLSHFRFRKVRITDYCIFGDRKNFVLEQKLWGWTYWRHYLDTAQIKQFKFINYQGIILETNFSKYCFGQDLNPDESQWLSQQMQDWIEQI
ncbi:serine/threonine protein kinase [Phormidium sp. LEGE 05292]|uniref:serine/threonine protein kinase n=1 Tax=[Phormidium] sp. LEGE 05292 TaxID=767427 RepID=UPI001881D751|nr:serine/threonine-protein kinase [Phormidium sp. LEGE 05292]MBE9225521.1 serine/threonine protein kinase [Phormidium sp. LEGE 05292]